MKSNFLGFIILLVTLMVSKSCVPLQKFEDDNMKAKIVFERKKEKFIDSIQKLFENKIKVLSKNNTTLQFQITKKNEEIAALNEEIAQQKLDFKSEQIDVQLQIKKDSTEKVSLQERLNQLTEDLKERRKDFNALKKMARSQGVDVSSFGVLSKTGGRSLAKSNIASTVNSTASQSQIAVLQANILQKDKEIKSLLAAMESLKSSEASSSGTAAIPNGVNTKGVYYRIQATTIKNTFKSKTVAAFGDMFTKDGNLVKVIYGYFSTYEEAVEGRKIVLQLGFDRSWIVKYKNGSRIN